MLVLAAVLVLAICVSALGLRAAGRVGSTRELQASELVWRVLSANTARTIPNAYIPTRARGLFVVVRLREANVSHRRVAVSNGHLVLRLGSSSYGESTSGNAALELSGHALLPSGVLGPASSVTGWVSFDVPARATYGEARLCVEQQASRTCLATPLMSAT